MVEEQIMQGFISLVTSWEVQGKRGCVWTRLGHADTVGDLDAVKAIRRYHKYKVCRVRKAAEHGIDASPWRTIRFK
jgi:hypothetical protein